MNKIIGVFIINLIMLILVIVDVNSIHIYHILLVNVNILALLVYGDYRKRVKYNNRPDTYSGETLFSRLAAKEKQDMGKDNFHRSF